MALRADDVDLERDRALVRRFQAGDDDAFGELYRRYHDRLERFCRKRVPDHHTAEEVAQEAFTRALTALPDLGGELRFYPWVSVIAARLCVDAHRRQSHYECAPSPDLGSVPGGQDDIVDAVDSSLVMNALARVAPRHRDVLHLREVEGWSYQRIAAHYGVRVGTVETLIFRARRSLRREFHLLDGAGLAALPMFGRMIQLAARVRDRVPAWLPSASSPAGIAAAATATAAAVALAVAPGPGAPKDSAPPPAAHAPAQAPNGVGARRPSAPAVPLPATTTQPAVAGTTVSGGESVVATAATTATTVSLTSVAPMVVPTTTVVPAGPPPAGGSFTGAGAGPVTAAVTGPVTAIVGSVTSAAASLPLAATLPSPSLGPVVSTVTNLGLPPVSSSSLLSSPPVDLGPASAPVVAVTGPLVGPVPGL